MKPRRAETVVMAAGLLLAALLTGRVVYMGVELIASAFRTPEPPARMIPNNSHMLSRFYPNSGPAWAAMIDNFPYNPVPASGDDWTLDTPRDVPVGASVIGKRIMFSGTGVIRFHCGAPFAFSRNELFADETWVATGMVSIPDCKVKHEVRIEHNTARMDWSRLP
jgi:hypothetical protein